MINVYSACCTDYTLTSVRKRFASYLTTDILTKALAYRHEQDGLLFVLGRLLLLAGIRRLNFSDVDLNSLRSPGLEKPFLQGCRVRFNISHSGEWVVCAVSDEYDVGIDIEKQTNTDLKIFRDCFDHQEWTAIQQSVYQCKVFYELWTKKEAVLKGDGRGLSIPLNQVHVLKDTVRIGECDWSLQKLDVAEQYSAHLAVNVKHYQLKMTELHLHAELSSDNT